MGDAQPVEVRSWWWCKRCHAYVDVVDPGDPFPQCEECRTRVHLCEPDGARVERANVAPTLAPLPQWDPPPEAKPMERTRKRGGLMRLPAEKRDLRVLARTGWWFCYECNNITEEAKDGGCAICGDALDRKLNWNEPAFREEEKS